MPNNHNWNVSVTSELYKKCRQTSLTLPIRTIDVNGLRKMQNKSLMNIGNKNSSKLTELQNFQQKNAHFPVCFSLFFFFLLPGFSGQ